MNGALILLMAAALAVGAAAAMTVMILRVAVLIVRIGAHLVGAILSTLGRIFTR